MIKRIVRMKNPVLDTYKEFRDFVLSTSLSGIILISCVIVAMAIANSSLSSQYFALWNTVITLSFDSFSTSHTLLHFINDGLMVIFFFLVGLEIKREVLVGHLSKVRQALFPVLAALGGIAFPATIYLLFSHDDVSMRGWAVPTATDIAFALGLLSLLGRKVPMSLKIFLTTVAIVDDIGGIMIIGMFYTDYINMTSLMLAAAIFSTMIVMNVAGVRTIILYVLMSVLLWLAISTSGIHPTIAGVIAAMTIPVKPDIDMMTYLKKSKKQLKFLDNDKIEDLNILQDTASQSALTTLETLSKQALSPLTKMEAGLHSIVLYGILPLFAFANSGITIAGDINTSAPVSIAIASGLIIGKPMGILIGSWLGVKLGLTQKPNDLIWRHIVGVGLIGGVGFTMAMFISTLVFENTDYEVASKLGIIAGSTIAGVAGLVVLSTTNKVQEDNFIND